LGMDRLATYAQYFGLGAPTGVDLPGEASGLVPTPKWKRLNFQQTWTTGDTYIASIGQGNFLVTPLQMAAVIAATANGGTLYRPQLIHHIADADGNIIQPFKPEGKPLPIDATVWQIVKEGLEIVVSEKGTAPNAMLTEIGIPVAGKTGTAEYCDDIALKAGRCNVLEGETLPTHAWFVAYAPAPAPEIAVVAWIYDGGEGSKIAAPVSRDIMDFYFRRELGLPPPGTPLTSTQTLTATVIITP